MEKQKGEAEREKEKEDHVRHVLLHQAVLLTAAASWVAHDMA